MFLAVAGIPRDWKEIGFLLVSAATLALGVWTRAHLPSRPSPEARASAGRRAPRRGPARDAFGARRGITIASGRGRLG
ncbi:MAG: hypothetical protein KatS3mg099_373 [Candidatus Parcubacteria bacterium]|nr:MAG: hypothetical protein KatS3mg099_373 [Candidatus Parcubacteria bacterium]